MIYKKNNWALQELKGVAPTLTPFLRQEDAILSTILLWYDNRTPPIMFSWHLNP